MADNKNPWRDIPTVPEWQVIRAAAVAATARARPLPVPPNAAAAPRAVRPGGRPLPPLPPLIDRLGDHITLYHAIPKDQVAQFDQRSRKLDAIADIAAQYVAEYRRANVSGVKDPGGKVLGNDTLDVWVASLAHRAAKKSGYLTTMAQWHQTAKAKYKDRVQMSIFLRGLAEGGHVRDGGEKLHATPYATIEKIDPYHRQTFVFLDPDDARADDEGLNEMGWSFLEYMYGSTWPGSTNPDPSFYEWLEYSPFCLGTPGVYGDARFRSPPTISYDGHDLTNVRVRASQLIAEQVVSAPGVWTALDTSVLPASGKGPPNAAAFVWDADCNLYLHPHGADGFVHASAKQGRKIRCSGMLVAENGHITYLSNMSGHYQPDAQSIYNFARWLHVGHCVRADAIVEIEHGTPPLNGQMPFPTFLNGGTARGYAAPGGLPYP